MYNIENVAAIDNEEDLIHAIKTLFSPELDASEGYIFQQRITLKKVARQLGCYDEAAGLIEYYADALNKRLSNGDDEITSDDRDYLELCRSKCSLDYKGNIRNTIENFRIIMANDPMFATLRMNQLTLQPEFADSRGIYHNWEDAQDAEGKLRIEHVYDLYSPSKYDDAFLTHTNRNKYHPIKEVLEPIKWDGVTRIPYLLSKWMGVEDNEYTREVSRLIFAGGIHRLYNPGCKFDDMPVLIGGQGAGKSTFVRWLAIEDRFFGELTTTDDKKGGEVLGGKWIMEVSELLALTRTKEQEEVKAFLTRQDDRFRGAWDKRVKSRLRTCVFIGTSNRDQFITDKTGGRRFYPVHCKSIGYDLFDHEDECREYIRQCWAEAREKRNTEYMAPYAKRDIKPFIEAAQSDAMEEDYRIGMIQAYLENHRDDLICTVTLWKDALGIDNKEPTKADQTQIGLIMKMFPDWEKKQRRKRTKYGQDRSWGFVGDRNAITCTTPNDFTPF